MPWDLYFASSIPLPWLVSNEIALLRDLSREGTRPVFLVLSRAPGLGWGIGDSVQPALSGTCA